LSFELNQEEGKFLIGLARQAVNEYLKTGKYVKPPSETPNKLFEKCGVFVTITKLKKGKKHLRGCIGYPYPTKRLVEAVIDSAINAATQDPRFNPLTKSELEEVVFEVSALTPPELIESSKPQECLSKFRVGEHGLIVEKGMFKGLLLPQVPVEWKWEEEEFLCQCCMKAGLPPDAWLEKGARIYRFKAIIFEEESPKGTVRLKTLGD
jgi:uncharacterized protein (TIGR00296 family)